MTSLVVSTIVYFIAAYFIKRQFDEMDIPKGMVRSLTIFALALALSYGAAMAVEWVVGAA
jgi:hypothetical protein